MQCPTLWFRRKKPQLLHEAEEEIKEIQGAFEGGLLSDEERYKRVIGGNGTETTNKVTDALKASLDTFNPITMMANSGARGSINQIRQLAGMRGLMADRPATSSSCLSARTSARA